MRILGLWIKQEKMRQVTIIATTLAALAFAGDAYADMNYGPVKNGERCWHESGGRSNGFGYWTKCSESRNAQATRTSTRNSRNATAAQRSGGPSQRPRQGQGEE